jgi:hypothetical protein
MTTIRMIKRTAAGLLLALVAIGVGAKDTDSHKRVTQSEYVNKNKPEKYRQQPKKREDLPVYSVPAPTGLALLSVGIGAIGLRLMLRRRKDD